jgi:hypothetical protein
MCLRRAPEKYIAGAALDRADLKASDDGMQHSEDWDCGLVNPLKF